MSLTKPIKIIIADDHEIVRNGFKKILQDQYAQEIEFVAEAANGAELVEAVTGLRPQLVLTDIQMPRMDGIQACQIIKQKYPATNVIAFSVFNDIHHIMPMLAAGANGYLAKTCSKEEIIDAIRIVSTGKPFYCSTISDKLYNTVINNNKKQQKDDTIAFSAQEIKVLKLLCRQFGTKEIAANMKLAVRTVENYRGHIQEKIGAKNMVGVALYAVVKEIVNLGELL
jgi:DNA-binding NarL/FixJ family response regulator